MKIWKSKEKGDDNIIAFFNDVIYKVNPRNKTVDEVALDFSMKIIPTADYMGIPLQYIKEIHLEEGKNYIVVLFNQDSYEHLRINDLQKRTEVFGFFKSNIPNATHLTDKYSKIRAGKKPLIAMGVVLAIFLWTFYISSGIEQGDDYEVVGNQRSLANIVLAIASLGPLKVSLIFGSLLAIALTSFVLKARKPKVIEKIILKS